MQLSASSAALDLAVSQSPGPDQNGWGNFPRHRQGQASLPMNTLTSQTNGSGSQSNALESPITARPSSNRYSMDLKYQDGPQEPQVSSPPYHSQTPPKLQSSYSANDVPTMRTGTNGTNSSAATPNSHAQQHLHNHNASLGRIPPNAMSNRASREVTSGESTALREAQNTGYQTISSALHASAPPFGPSLTQSISQLPVSGMTSPTAQQQYGGVPNYYGNGSGYNMQMMNMGMQNMSMGPQAPMYSPHNPYAYGNAVGMYNPPPPRDSQARVIQQRRQNDNDSKLPKKNFIAQI